MLDTHGRKIINKIMHKLAGFFANRKITPNQITVFALFLGLAAALCIIMSKPYLSVLFLWLSGLFDVLDGEVARMTQSSSDYGMILDIFFDRVVEGSILITIAYINPHLQFSIALLFFSILLSMTIFLISGGIIDKKSKKSFYYQAGLMERTEGFILLTVIIIMQNQLWINVFTALIVITIIQRFSETLHYLKKN